MTIRAACGTSLQVSAGFRTQRVHSLLRNTLEATVKPANASRRADLCQLTKQVLDCTFLFVPLSLSRSLSAHLLLAFGAHVLGSFCCRILWVVCDMISAFAQSVDLQTLKSQCHSLSFVSSSLFAQTALEERTLCLGFLCFFIHIIWPRVSCFLRLANACLTCQASAASCSGSSSFCP